MYMQDVTEAVCLKLILTATRKSYRHKSICFMLFIITLERCSSRAARAYGARNPDLSPIAVSPAGTGSD